MAGQLSLAALTLRRLAGALLILALPAASPPAAAGGFPLGAGTAADLRRAMERCFTLVLKGGRPPKDEVLGRAMVALETGDSGRACTFAASLPPEIAWPTMRAVLAARRERFVPGTSPAPPKGEAAQQVFCAAVGRRHVVVRFAADVASDGPIAAGNVMAGPERDPACAG